MIWCVRGKDEGWHATFRNVRPSEKAWSDRLACGDIIILRWDQQLRKGPQCPKCKKAVARRRSR